MIFGKKKPKESAFMKELKSWAKPTKGLVFTPGKAAYHVAKAAVRHPYIALTAGAIWGKKQSRFKRNKAWYDSPLSGQYLKKGGKWML